MLRFMPPIIVGLGLAIMEVTAQARSGYFPTPWSISMIATVISPWFVGVLTVTIGAYLFSMIDLNIDFMTFIGYIINVFVMGGYFILGNPLAHALFMDFLHLWNWHTVFGYFGIPIDTVVGLIISYVILAMEKPRYIIL